MEAIDKVIKVKRKAARMEKELAALQAQLRKIPTWTRLSSTDPYLSQIKLEWDPSVQQRESQEDEAHRHHYRAVPETIDLEAAEEPAAQEDISKYKTKYQAMKQAYKELKTTTRELRTRLEEAEAENAPDVETAATEKTYVNSATTTDMFDPKSWTLSVTQWFQTSHANIFQRPGLRSIKPFLNGKAFQKPPTWEVLASTDDFFQLSQSEMLFHTSDINHGLVVLPEYRFFPEGVDRKNKKNQWQLDTTAPARGQVRDVFLRRDQVSWIYLGEYQCVFSDVVDLNRIPFVNHKQIVQNAIMQRDSVPRVSEDMIKGMYATGILKVQCFGLRCIGFNEELDRQLHNKGGKSGSAAPQSSTKTAGRKRKSEAEHEGPKSKKKKGEEEPHVDPRLWWAHGSQYSRKAKDKEDMERTVREYFRFLAERGVRGAGKVVINTTLHKSFPHRGMPSTTRGRYYRYNTLDRRDHVQVVVYGSGGERLDVVSGKGKTRQSMHIPDDRNEWEVVVLVPKED